MTSDKAFQLVYGVLLSRKQSIEASASDKGLDPRCLRTALITIQQIAEEIACNSEVPNGNLFLFTLRPDAAADTLLLDRIEAELSLSDGSVGKRNA